MSILKSGRLILGLMATGLICAAVSAFLFGGVAWDLLVTGVLLFISGVGLGNLLDD